MLYRNAARGASLLEAIVLLGMIALLGMTGVRVLGLDTRALVSGQAKCVADLGGPTCEAAQGPGLRAGARLDAAPSDTAAPTLAKLSSAWLADHLGVETVAVRAYAKGRPTSSPTASGSLSFPAANLQAAPSALTARTDDGSAAEDVVRLYWRVDCMGGAMVQMLDLQALEDPSTDPHVRAVLDWYWNDPSVELPASPMPSVSAECFWKVYMDWRACGRASPNLGEMGQGIAEEGCE